MLLLTFLLLLAGAICFLLAAKPFRPATLLPVGLLCWILVPLIHTGRALFAS